jgi:hypothetical protein
VAAGEPPPSAEESIPGFKPENERERALARDERVLRGLTWGKPRHGHPEGSVGAHVADLLRTLETWELPEPLRSDLRFIALVHDSLKREVKEWLPKTGENHHAMRARRLAEGYTDDERLLATIEQHDRPYAIWRRMRRKGRLDEPALEDMLARIPDPELFLRFVELDGSSEAKNPEPVRWLREELEKRGSVQRS